MPPVPSTAKYPVANNQLLILYPAIPPRTPDDASQQTPIYHLFSLKKGGNVMPEEHDENTNYLFDTNS